MVKDNLIVMEFLGKDSDAAPRIRDVTFSMQQLSECYLNIIKLMRQLFWKCKLVHADLSEYNL